MLSKESSIEYSLSVVTHFESCIWFRESVSEIGFDCIFCTLLILGNFNYSLSID